MNISYFVKHALLYYTHGSLASGFLSGKYKRGVPPVKGVDRFEQTRRAKQYRFSPPGAILWTARVLLVVAVLGAFSSFSPFQKLKCLSIFRKAHRRR